MLLSILQSVDMTNNKCVKFTLKFQAVALQLANNFRGYFLPHAVGKSAERNLANRPCAATTIFLTNCTWRL